MSDRKEYVSPRDLLSLIEDFVNKSSGLKIMRESETEIRIFQKLDSKEITLEDKDLSDVIFRKDPREKDFIQVNLSNGEKILLTDQLVGFKPQSVENLDVNKLPRVVTTLDLFAVLDAIEEASLEPNNDSESLKNIFHSILLGGEKAGFDLTSEKTWLKRIPVFITKVSS